MNVFMQKNGIVLRSIKSEDRDLFVQWHNDPELRNMIGGIFPFTERTFESIIKLPEEDTPSSVWFSICQGENLIGIAGLHSIKYVQRNAEIAILIGEPEKKHQGIGSVVMEMVTEYAFMTLNLHRIYAFVFSENLPSRKLFEKNSFSNEGELRDANFWNGKYRNVLIFGKIKESRS